MEYSGITQFNISGLNYGEKDRTVVILTLEDGWQV